MCETVEPKNSNPNQSFGNLLTEVWRLEFQDELCASLVWGFDRWHEKVVGTCFSLSCVAFVCFRVFGGLFVRVIGGKSVLSSSDLLCGPSEGDTNQFCPFSLHLSNLRCLIWLHLVGVNLVISLLSQFLAHPQLRSPKLSWKLESVILSLVV